MGRTLLFLVVLVLVIWAGIYFYRNYRHERSYDNGAVTCQGCMTPEQKTAFLRENSGEGPDGQSEHKWDFSRGADGERREWSAADDPNGEGPAPDGFPPASPAYDNRNVQTSYQTQYQAPSQNSYGQPASPPPARDSEPRQAPNGVGFAGRGVYQWYRQGNITWRLNTETGASCVAYATMEEWRNRLVLSHGCGNSY